jgi:hypothetical protein
MKQQDQTPKTIDIKSIDGIIAWNTFYKGKLTQKETDILIKNIKQFLSEKLGNFWEKFHQNLDKIVENHCIKHFIEKNNGKIIEGSMDVFITREDVENMLDEMEKQFKKDLGVE